MQAFDADATLARLPYAALIDALRARFAAGDSHAPTRQVFDLGPGRMLLMPAWRDGGRFVLKTASVFGANRARGLSTVHAVVLHFDGASGAPLAQIDGNVLTTRRTAAASALAASMLARADAQHMALIGAGRVAHALPEAMRGVRPIASVAVWNRDARAAQALVATLAGQGFEARLAASPRDALRGAHIVSCATAATAPLLQGAWLEPGMHLDLVGGWSPQMQEADRVCVQRATVFVDTDDALAKAGELAGAQRAATLAMLCRGEHAGRSSTDEITLFKSVGHALEDLAAAELVFDAPARMRPPRLFWEDFAAGSVREFGAMHVSADAIRSFARQFDPQPFHLDDAAAAASLFGKLSASGWHACAMAMRMMCDDYLLESASLGSPGIDSLRWRKPVHPHDVLSMRFTVLEARPMASRPGVGLVRSRWEVVNQDDAVVLTMEGWGMFRRRPAAADPPG